MKEWFAVVTDVPGDGACMYHAIGHFLKINGKTLRFLVTQFISKNPDVLLHDQSIRNWILWDRKISVEQYVQKMEKGQWGGALEMTILASIFKVPIFVYERKQQYVKRISESRPDTTILSLSIHHSLPYICILYTGSHYMAIKAIEK